MSSFDQDRPISRRHVLVIGVAGTVAVVLAACGASTGTAAPATSPGPGGSTPPSPGGGGTGLRISILGDSALGGSFDPPALTVGVGDTVTWENASAIVHNVSCDPDNPSGMEHTLPEGAEPFNAGSVDPGETFEHTFDVAGEYLYGCTMHSGHAGTLTVTG